METAGDNNPLVALASYIIFPITTTDLLSLRLFSGPFVPPDELNSKLVSSPFSRIFSPFDNNKKYMNIFLADRSSHPPTLWLTTVTPIAIKRKSPPAGRPLFPKSVCPSVPPVPLVIYLYDPKLPMLSLAELPPLQAYPYICT